MNKDCIPCTIGILSYNSEENLRRCLNSVRGFCEIILADGGSTDKTVEIAKEYRAKIITQSNPGHKITDFALERNILLDAASYDWFFYIDTDEFMSPELKEDIRRISSEKTPEKLVYLVPYHVKSEDLKVTYKQFKVYKQTRLFHKKSGARFIKPIHERIDFNRDKVKVGEIRGPWYGTLPAEVLVFSEYRKKVEYRISLMVGTFSTRDPRFLFNKLRNPVKEAFKQIFKIVYLRVRYPWSTLMPLRYEFYRLYSHIFAIYKIISRYLKVIFGIR